MSAPDHVHDSNNVSTFGVTSNDALVLFHASTGVVSIKMFGVVAWGTRPPTRRFSEWPTRISSVSSHSQSRVRQLFWSHAAATMVLERPRLPASWAPGPSRPDPVAAPASAPYL